MAVENADKSRELILAHFQPEKGIENFQEGVELSYPESGERAIIRKILLVPRERLVNLALIAKGQNLWRYEGLTTEDLIFSFIMDAFWCSFPDKEIGKAVQESFSISDGSNVLAWGLQVDTRPDFDLPWDSRLIGFIDPKIRVLRRIARLIDTHFVLRTGNYDLLSDAVQGLTFFDPDAGEERVVEYRELPNRHRRKVVYGGDQRAFRSGLKGEKTFQDLLEGDLRSLWPEIPLDSENLKIVSFTLRRDYKNGRRSAVFRNEFSADGKADLGWDIRDGKRVLLNKYYEGWD